MQLEEYLRYPDEYQVLGIVSVDGSPSCGYGLTCRGNWGGELSGNMDEVSKLLGTDYQISGTVVHGRHIGTALGFPTANIDYLSEYIVPACGVYAGQVIVKGKKHLAMINVGHNPTVNYRNDISIEAHILDFDEDIYGCSIRVIFHSFLRSEKKFASKGNLIMQLEQDAAHVRRIYA